jgi:hypothetical protein
MASTPRYHNVRFVPQSMPSVSQRARELEVSKSKAHAARSAHQRRKDQLDIATYGFVPERNGEPTHIPVGYLLLMAPSGDPIPTGSSTVPTTDVQRP